MPTATPRFTVSVSLDWTHGRFPADFFCRTYKGGCDWALVPVFGGVALAAPDDSGTGYQWAWTADGTRWQPMRNLPRDFEGLEPDGTPAGAFAVTQTWVDDATAVTTLWRTTDGSSWRQVPGVTGDGALSISRGRYVLTRHHGFWDFEPPNRVLASADGWAWREVAVPGMPADEIVALDGGDAGFLAQWTSEEDDPIEFSWSDDGLIWSGPQRAPREVEAVYRTPAGFVGFEVEGANSNLWNGPEGGLVATWTSSDGSSWRRHETVGQPSYEDDSMEHEARIYAVPGGFLLDMFQSDLGMFFSRDGLTWVPVIGPPERACSLHGITLDTLVCLGDGWGFWMAHLPPS